MCDFFEAGSELLQCLGWASSASDGTIMIQAVLEKTAESKPFSGC